jgi:prophage regulatory protein
VKADNVRGNISRVFYSIFLEGRKMTKAEQTTQKERFLRLPMVLERIPVSKSSWWSGIRAGKFPKPVKLSMRTSAWRESDIDTLCDQFAPKVLDDHHPGV